MCIYTSTDVRVCGSHASPGCDPCWGRGGASTLDYVCGTVCWDLYQFSGPWLMRWWNEVGVNKGALRGHATHRDGIVLNVTKLRIPTSSLFFALRYGYGRPYSIEVLRSKCVKGQHFYGISDPTCSTRISIFNYIQHYAVYI